MNAHMRMRNWLTRFAIGLAITGVLALVSACTREETAQFLTDLPAAYPRADISITPSLYCPGETLRFDWDAGPQLSGCILEPHYDPYTRETAFINVGTGYCKFTSMNSPRISYPFPGWENSPSLEGRAYALEPHAAGYPGWDGVSMEFEVVWYGWDWPWPNQWSWGTNRHDGDMLGGGQRSGHYITSWAFARLMGSGPGMAGITPRHQIVVEGQRFCNQETHTWNYLPGTQTVYRQMYCPASGPCTSTRSVILSRPIGETFSACSTLTRVCAGQASMTFSAPSVGLNTTQSQYECSDDLSDIGLSASAIDGAIETVPGPDWANVESEPCHLDGEFPYSYPLYTIEISPCRTPDQLTGYAAERCLNATTMSVSQGIQFEAAPPDDGTDDAPIQICDLSQSCGDADCDAFCESDTNCPADCAVSTAPPAECAPGWLPASGCTCCGSTLTCADGTVAQFNPACMSGGTDGGAGDVCGDGVCSAAEAAVCGSCSADCGPC